MPPLFPSPTFFEPDAASLLDTPVDTEVITLGGLYWSRGQVSRFLGLAAAGASAVALTGSPGTGKTLFARNAAAEALRLATGREWLTVFAEPHTQDGGQSTELFWKTNFKFDTGLQVEGTYLVTQGIEPAIERRQPLLIVLDELSRIHPTGQAVLYSLCSSGLLVGRDGREYQLKHFLVLATLNPEGSGTYALSPALRNRFKFLPWHLPETPETTARMILQEWERSSASRLDFRDHPELPGLRFSNRPVQLPHALAVARAASRIGAASPRQEPPSLRLALTALGLYHATADLSLAADEAVVVLTADLPQDTPQTRGLCLELRAQLREAWGATPPRPPVNGNRRRV